MLQSLHIHGYPVALAALLFIAAFRMWKYKKLHRVSAWFFGAAAFFMAMGFTPWTDALARLVTPGTGFVVLLGVDIIGGFAVWYEAIRKHHHHRIKTPVLMMAAGTALLLTIGSGTRFLREAARSPRKTGSALSQSISQISSGHAAHHISQHGALKVLAVAVLFVVALIVFGHKHEQRGGGRGSFGGTPPAIGSGKPSGSGGSGRSPLSIGSNRGKK